MLFNRPNQPPTPTGKKRTYFLLFQLVLAFALMFLLFRLATQWDNGFGKRGMAGDPLVYNNQEYAFAVRVPDANWKIISSAGNDSLRRVGVYDNLLDAGKTAVRLEKRIADSLSVYAEIGVLLPDPPRASYALAAWSLHQIRERFRAEKDSAVVIAPPTAVTSKIMDGTFFVVEVPTNEAFVPHEFNVWVCTYIAKPERSYVIICKTRSEDYNRLREDVQFVLQEFRLL